jgi:hypothetical protein
LPHQAVQLVRRGCTLTFPSTVAALAPPLAVPANFEMLIPVRAQHIELRAHRRVQQPLPVAEVFRDRSSHLREIAPDLLASIQVGRRWQHHRPRVGLLIEHGLDVGRFLQQRQELLPEIGTRRSSPCPARLSRPCFLLAGYLSHLGLQVILAGSTGEGP